MSRFPPIPPPELQGEQKQIHEEMLEGVTKMFSGKGFVYQRADGALVGPFAPLMYTPLLVARHFFALASSLSSIPGLPVSARETAILTTGAIFGCKYEVYAHEAVAETTGALSRKQIEKLAIGKLPDPEDGEADTHGAVSVAYDVTMALVKERGPLNSGMWDMAVGEFGREGAAALVNYVGVYCYTCVILNGFDVPVPDE